MRSKKSEKKLTLNKATVADLNRDEMSAVFGGGDTSCETICTGLSCLDGGLPTLKSIDVSC